MILEKFSLIYNGFKREQMNPNIFESDHPYMKRLDEVLETRRSKCVITKTVNVKTVIANHVSVLKNPHVVANKLIIKNDYEK